MANERITDGIVRDHFKANALSKSVKWEEQKSGNKRITELLKGKSKGGGNGNGYPDYFGNFIYVFSLSAIILLSFFLYSSRFYALLNSDDALNILMAHYYKLPKDFYCWGQDRGGTLIPLLSQFFIKTFGCSALLSVSFSNYIILVLGFLGLSSLIKSRYYKIIFAIVWFLPFQRFIDITRFPIGVEYSLLGIAIFLISKIEDLPQTTNTLKKHVLLILTVLVLVVSVWVSDLSIVSIIILIFVLVLFNFIKNKSLKLDKTAVCYAIAGAILCFLFIRFAKSFAVVKTEHYLTINGLSQIKQAFVILKNAFLDVLLFKKKELFVGIYTYVAIIFFVFFAIKIFRKPILKRIISNKWTLFFILDLITIFIVIILSSWVLANKMGRWYFVSTYISLSVTVILILDNLKVNNKSNILKYGILCLVLIGAISPIHTMKYVYPKRLTPKADVVGEFRQLGEIGVIAEYWNSYSTSCPVPDLIIATPHDKSDVKNRQLVDMVFERENIYVIKDMWMDTFPDTLYQFGYVLLKSGEPFNIGNCDVCKYDKAK